MIRTSEVKTVLQRVQTSNSVLLGTPNTEFECMYLRYNHSIQHIEYVQH
jgi:hypothetical protein